MKRIIVVLCAFCLLSLLVNAQESAHHIINRYAGEVKPATPPTGHPRVYLRPDDVVSLRKRYEHQSPQTNLLRKWIKEEASYDTDGIVQDGQPLEATYRAYEANAFFYLIYQDKEKGLKAKRQVLNYFRTLQGGKYKRPAFTSRKKTYSIRGAALVYDWCYDLFTTGERAELIENVIRIAKSTEYGWPVVLPNGGIHHEYVTAHWAEEKHANMLAFGIACYDEDPHFYDLMAKDLYENFVPLRNFKNAGHKFEQGNFYSGRFIHELETTALITGMGADNPYTPDQAKVLHYRIYSLRPDGLVMPEGDGFMAKPFHGRQLPAYLIGAKIYKDPLLQWAAHSFLNKQKKGSWARTKYGAAMMLCWYDEKLVPAKLDTMPLTRYFPTPHGNMITRTGWGLDVNNPAADKNVAIIKLDMAEYNLGGHAHADAGNFSIYYKGPLAIDAGIYGADKKGKKFGGDIHSYYYTKTIAHNSLLIHDPDYVRRHGSNSGGQFVFPKWKTTGELEQMTRRTMILGHDFGPDPDKPEYSYLSGDLTRAYRSDDLDQPNKVKEVKRSFVVLNHFNEKNPASLIVFDRITSRSPDFKKTWLLHAQQKPLIEGTKQIVFHDDTKRGYRGKLVNETLLPAIENAEIKLIGGPGREFEVQGVDYPPKNPEEIDTKEGGRWRIELSPEEAGKTDLFLNVSQVMDSRNGAVELPVMKVEGEDFVGAAISDRLVLFSKEMQNISKKVRFEVPDIIGKYKVLITGLNTGEWMILTQGKKQRITVSKEAGTLYLPLGGGKYVLRPLQTSNDRK